MSAKTVLKVSEKIKDMVKIADAAAGKVDDAFMDDFRKHEKIISKHVKNIIAKNHILEKNKNSVNISQYYVKYNSVDKTNDYIVNDIKKGLEDDDEIVKVSFNMFKSYHANLLVLALELSKREPSRQIDEFLSKLSSDIIYASILIGGHQKIQKTNVTKL